MYELELTPRSDDHSWSADWRPVDRATGRVVGKKYLMESGFILEYFQVDILLVVGGVNFSLSKPGIPVLDFGLMMDFAAKELKRSGLVEAETSISQDMMGFHARNGRVEMITGYASGTAYTSLEEVCEIARETFDASISLLLAAHGDLNENFYIRSLIEKMESESNY